MILIANGLVRDADGEIVVAVVVYIRGRERVAEKVELLQAVNERHIEASRNPAHGVRVEVDRHALEPGVPVEDVRRPRHEVIGDSGRSTLRGPGRRTRRR
jgi:hypothetical protein